MKENSYDLNARLTLSPHTRRVRVAEKIAKSILWIAAAITMGTLLLIVGYILYRGFVSDMRIQYDVLPGGSSIIAADEVDARGIAIIVNRIIRADDLQIRDVVELFNGGRDNWGGISEQDIDVQVFGRIEGDPVKVEFERSVFVEGPVYADGAVFVDSDSEVIKNVSQTLGGIGYISAANINQLEGSDAKVLEIRRISIVTNPAVTEFHEGQRIRYLTGEQVSGIFSGQYNNWSELGGADWPITVVAFSADSLIYREFNDIMFAAGYDITNDVIWVDTIEELTVTLARNSNAIGFVYYNDALIHELPVLRVERRVTELNLSPAFIFEEPRRAGRVGGISSIILNTLFMIAMTVLLAAPIGVAAAIYLTEYAQQNRMVEVLRFGTETLAGIPSIIFGLFGFILFVMYLNIGVGLLSGTLTITFMILPTIIRTSEESIKSVPASLRECSLALGATKWQTIIRVVVPAAIPGILTGLILGVGRAVGETAALLFTMGSDYRMARDLLSSARVMSVHLYILVREGISFERAFATGAIMIIIILIINFTANKLIGRMVRMHG